MKQRSDGRWEKLITIDGKKKHFFSRAKTEKQAEKDIAAQLVEYDIKMHKKKHNFGELAEQMLEAKERTVSASTMTSYKYALKHLDIFFDMDIENIQPRMIQCLLAQMSEAQYSQSAIAKVKIVFGLVLDFAVMQGVEISNYMRSVKAPRAPRAKISAPDDNIIARIKKSSEVDFADFALVLLYTGMRRGELVALQRKDIDLKKGFIYVKKSIEYISNQPVIKAMPKTVNSVRAIPILNDLAPILLRLCDNAAPDDFIFGGSKPFSLIMLRRRWDKYIASIGCPDLHMHQLRHAYAKILYRAGIDVKTAQGLLGHADIKTTMDIYTDFSDDMVKNSIDKVNDFFANSF